MHFIFYSAFIMTAIILSGCECSRKWNTVPYAQYTAVFMSAGMSDSHTRDHMIMTRALGDPEVLDDVI